MKQTDVVGKQQHPFIVYMSELSQKIAHIQARDGTTGPGSSCAEYIEASKAMKHFRKAKSSVPDTIRKMKQEYFQNTTSEQRLKQLTRRIRRYASRSPDGVARMLVLKEVIYEAMDKQRMGHVWCDPPLWSTARNAGLTSLAIFPPEWKNPATPFRERLFGVGEMKEAFDYAEEQCCRGNYARVITSGDKVDEALAFDPFRYLERMADYESGRESGWIVQIWKPARFLQYLAAYHSQSDLLDALHELAMPGNSEHHRLAKRQSSGSVGNQAKSKHRFAAQRALYEELRQQYCHDWKKESIINAMCKPTPRKPKDKLTPMEKLISRRKRGRGWGVSIVKKKLRGMK